jgi:hypothetical protein
MIMENEKKPAQDTTKVNSHKDMPVKTTGTDNTKNTAAEDGLNRDKKPNAHLEPGTSSDPDFTETD